MRWFCRGDLDGFFGLALDNLVQLLLIAALWKNVLGFPEDLLYAQVLPGVAVSLFVGNFYYALQAKRLAQATGRDDVCALPYGINTVSLLAYVFLVMLPAKSYALEQGIENPARFAWQAGLLACAGSGVIELCGAFFAERLRRATPRAALLATLSGIALGFISLTFVYRTFARPVVGLTTLAIILLTYFGGVRFPAGLPGGLVAVACGTAIAWSTGIAGGEMSGNVGINWPIPVLGDLFASSTPDNLAAYFSIILPMGIFNVIGSLQNIESAEAAGDTFPTAPSLAVNGIGTLAAAAFGSCFPTTIYIGHPGWKAMGARAGYSILNAIFFTFICLTGTLAYIVWAVPIDAGMAIVIWIGIIITAQAFQTTPGKHAPAVVVGLLPAVGAWGTLMALNGLRAAGYGAPGGPQFSPELIDKFLPFDIWLRGGLALEQGFIFTSMILAAATVALIERKFVVASSWCWLAAGLSAAGLMHSYRFTQSGTAILLAPAWDWVFGYALMALCFFFARFLNHSDANAIAEQNGMLD
ncbi:MAG: permease [Gemmatales bacterium]|nr:MAG: permease [Gemmatales bacterium]